MSAISSNVIRDYCSNSGVQHPEPQSSVDWGKVWGTTSQVVAIGGGVIGIAGALLLGLALLAFLATPPGIPALITAGMVCLWIMIGSLGVNAAGWGIVGISCWIQHMHNSYQRLETCPQ